MRVKRVAVLTVLAAAVGVAGAAEPAASSASEGAATARSPGSGDVGPDGLRGGGFLFNVGAGASRSHDDNLYATPVNTESSLITTFTPWFSVTSDWKRHRLRLQGGAETASYTGHSDENYTDHFLRLDGRYDLPDGGSLFGALSDRADHEDRTAVDVLGTAAEPTRYRETQAVVGTSQPFANGEVRVGVTATDLDFADAPLTGGGTANNDDRNRQEYELGGRIIARRGAPWQPFVQAAVNRRDYEQRRDDLGFERSSEGSSVAVGVVRGVKDGSAEVFIGRMEQSYDDPRFDRIHTWDAGARVNAPVTLRTRLRMSADRSIEETTLGGVPASVDTLVSASLEHRLASRLTASLPVYWVRSDFQQGARTDDVTGVGLTLDYRMTREATISGGYRFERRDSSEPTASYADGTAFVGVAAQLAAPPIEPFDRPATSGIYAGLDAGALFSDSDVTAPRGPAGSNGYLDAEFGDLEALGGGFLGYGWSLDRWLVALELSGDHGSRDWVHDRGRHDRNFGLERGVSYALSGRLGYWLSPAALVYARAGYAATEYDVNYDDGRGHNVDETETRRGVRFGTGLELALTNRLFGRFEWTYTDYEPFDVDYVRGVDTFAPTESVIRLGLGYRFFDTGRGKAPRHGASAFDGPYLGAQVGWDSLHTDNTGNDRGTTGDGTLIADRAGDGAAAGLFAGYGTTFGNLYLGLELDGEHSEAGWRSERMPERRTYSVDKTGAYGAGIRLGYVLGGDALIYARASRVRSRFDTDYRFEGVGVDIQDSRDLWGLRTGVGVEVPASRHTFLRLDYTYTDYGAYRIDYGSGTESFDTADALVRAGVGYRF